MLQTETSSSPSETPIGWTVPSLALQLNVGLDRLRKLLRGHDELRSMFTPLGGQRVLPTGRMEEFRQALAKFSPSSSSHCSGPRNN